MSNDDTDTCSASFVYVGHSPESISFEDLDWTVTGTGPDVEAPEEPQDAGGQAWEELAAATPAAPPLQPSEATAGCSWSETDHRQVQEAKVAIDTQRVQQAAYAYTMKLTAGLKSAIGGLGKTDSPGPGLSQLAGGFANWWAPPGHRNQPQQGQGGDELHKLLGLQPEEEVVQSFKCKLVQTYACSHNCLTPTIQMAFQGTLHITDKHCCFLVEERNNRLPLKVLHHDIVKAGRQRQQRKGAVSNILHLYQDNSGQKFVVFQDFEVRGALDSALALVQHFMGEHQAEHL